MTEIGEGALEQTQSKAVDRFDIEDLLYLMRRLRDPQGGCPWDLQQNYKTIAPSTLEEAYEVVDAIEREDYAHLKEELGDLLFQTIFYSQLAVEEQRFSFAEIVDTLVAKLIRRHPHVFPDGTLRGTGDASRALAETEVKQNWEAIKEQERVAKGVKGVLADVPVALPAVTRAVKLQKRAARIGFDWADAKGVMLKLSEEMRELAEAVDGSDERAIEAEVGDLLFTCVNLARHLKVDPESALRRSNQKFTARFQEMERAAAEAGQELNQLSQEALEHLWQQAKTLHP
jgi:ATP diphosphatase